MCSPCYQAWYQVNKRKPRARKDPDDFSPNYRRPPFKLPRNADCHPDRPHVALGLCRACYQLDRPGRPRAECHPGRPLVAHGKCGMCLSRTAYWDDPEKAKAAARSVQKGVRERLRLQMLEAYGGRCACPKCPESNPDFLCLDHVNGDGKMHRLKVGSHTYADLRKRGWPQEEYRLLCWNCNSGTRWGKPCPHERED